ncbi:DUF4168 domain-containing protein [Roseovarius tibetensis]|uniref:DUF4168 domain-containing protein n=1 Tax=Roseovarius tibetensis TaxID=2685897 RepID=UPI003D7FFCE5
MTFRTSLAAIFGAAALAFAAPAVAQDGQPAQIAAEDVTDAQVEAFVDAILAVEEVRDEYGPVIEDAEDEAAQQKLVQEANEAAFAAVDAVENMDVDSYVSIANAAGNNEELNQRVIERLTEVRGE